MGTLSPPLLSKLHRAVISPSIPNVVLKLQGIMDYIIPPSLKGTQGLGVSDCDPMSVYQSIFLNILGMPCLCKTSMSLKIVCFETRESRH